MMPRVSTVPTRLSSLCVCRLQIEKYGGQRQVLAAAGSRAEGQSCQKPPTQEALMLQTGSAESTRSHQARRIIWRRLKSLQISFPVVLPLDSCRDVAAMAESAPNGGFYAPSCCAWCSLFCQACSFKRRRGQTKAGSSHQEHQKLIIRERL